MVFISNSPEQTINIGKIIGKHLVQGDVIALQGTLAAGKTTLTKGIALGLDIIENITSPTFNVISEYQGRFTLYHMDVYRLDGTEDFIDLGVDEMLYGKGVCIIEWSEKVMSELPPDHILISLQITTNDSRRISVQNWQYGDIDNEYTCT